MTSTTTTSESTFTAIENIAISSESSYTSFESNPAAPESIPIKSESIDAISESIDAISESPITSFESNPSASESIPIKSESNPSTWQRHKTTGSLEIKSCIEAYCYRSKYFADNAQTRALKRKALLHVLRQTTPLLARAYLDGVIYRAGHMEEAPKGEASNEFIQKVNQVVSGQTTGALTEKRSLHKLDYEVRQWIVDLIMQHPQLTRSRSPEEFAKLFVKCQAKDKQLTEQILTTRIQEQRVKLMWTANEWYANEVWLNAQVGHLMKDLSRLLCKRMDNAITNQSHISNPPIKDEKWQVPAFYPYWPWTIAWESVMSDSQFNVLAFLRQSTNTSEQLQSALYAWFDRMYVECLNALMAIDPEIQNQFDSVQQELCTSQPVKLWYQHDNTGIAHYLSRINSMEMASFRLLFHQALPWNNRCWEDGIRNHGRVPGECDLRSAVRICLNLDLQVKQPQPSDLYIVARLRRLMLFSMAYQSGIDWGTIGTTLFQAHLQLFTEEEDRLKLAQQKSTVCQLLWRGWLKTNISGQQKQLIRLLLLQWILCDDPQFILDLVKYISASKYNVSARMETIFTHLDQPQVKDKLNVTSTLWKLYQSFIKLPATQVQQQ